MISSSRRFLQKRTNKFNFITMIPQVDLFLFIFWRKLMKPKRHFKINWPLALQTYFCDVKGHSSSRKSSHNIHHIHSPNWCMDHLSKVFPFVNKIQPYWAVSVWVLSLTTQGKTQSNKCHQTQAGKIPNMACWCG